MTQRVVVEGVTKVFDVPPSGGGHRALIAVDGVDLLVESGQAVSLVGPNGAGKSTLLRMIAGITVPTVGSIRRSRHCASLIELGSGFHPDLTARENLELGLAMAGVPRARRQRLRSDAIDFAGLGRNIDLPTRHLSSGLLGRLASAVAVATRPDLLLIDEVLAVGDASFQRQMLSTVETLVGGGSSLILVTHSLELAAIATSRTVWISQGRVVADGPSAEVLDRYEEEVRGWARSLDPTMARIDEVSIDPDVVEPGGSCHVMIDLTCSAQVGSIMVRVELRPEIGTGESWMRRADESAKERELNLVAFSESPLMTDLTPGSHHLELCLDPVPITESRLEVSILVTDASGKVLDEALSELQIGHRQLRPFFHVEARVHR